MWSIQERHTVDGEQKRRVEVYRQPPGPHLGSAVGFRSPRLPRHAAVDCVRRGYEPVLVQQRDSVEELWLARRASQPAAEDSVVSRGRGGASTGALPGLIEGQQGGHP